jgi:hypothetical protein
MPQTVFTVGNPITSRIKLGVTPDGTTTVTLQVFKPDGTTITAPAISAFTGTGGDEKTAQWYTTDDGQAGSPVLESAGDWVALWQVTGTGAVTAAKVYNVVPLPSTGTRVAWSPFLSEVADHVPWLTVDQVTVGSETYLGTFNGNTVPTDEQAQRHIDKAAAPILAIGAVPQPLYAFARGIVALRAAASLARAFPRYENALNIAAALDKQADTDWKSLLALLEDEGAVNDAPAQPVWCFPPPVYHRL